MLAGKARTTYLLDVRSADEATGDPFPAAQHALSGQLVQASDQWVAVRRARLVLLDDTGLRAAVAGFWLKQMGFEPVVVRLDGGDAAPLRALPAATDTLPDAATTGADEALDLAAAGKGMLIDLRPSMAYRAAHVAGAAWSIRPRLRGMADSLAGRRALLIADDPAIAALAARDLALVGVDATMVSGGHAALVDAGAAVARTPDTPCDNEAIDFLFFVHDRHDGNLDAARGYLAWEIALTDQLSPAERAAFRLLDPRTFA
jgi:rhodanese-related sulfurtransferase